MDNENKLDDLMRHRISLAIDELRSEGLVRTNLKIERVDCKINQDEKRHFADYQVSFYKGEGEDEHYQAQLKADYHDDSQSLKEIKHILLASLPDKMLK